MFIPQNYKYKKTFRPRVDKRSKSFSKMSNFCYGSFGFKAISTGWISSIHLIAIRKIVSKHLKRSGGFCFKIFPNFTVTKKPLEVRMGKGKGNVDSWVFPIKTGVIFLEFKEITLQKAEELFDLCKVRLPIKIKLIKNDCN